LAARACFFVKAHLQRHWLLAFIALAYLLCYVDRMVMATAAPFVAKDLNLTTVQMGALLSAFFVGYTVMQIPGGLLVDSFGPRRMLTVSLVWWSVWSALTGMAGGFSVLLTTRVLFGIGEGPFPPAAASATAQAFPRGEVGRANGVQLAMTSIGAAFAPLFVVGMMEQFGWRSAFLALLFPGLALAWISLRVIPSRANSEGRTQRGSKGPGVAGRLGEIVRIPGVLPCAATLFCLNCVSWGLMSWLPTYLVSADGITSRAMAVLTASANIAGAIGYPLGGYIGDRLGAGRYKLPVAGLAATALLTFVVVRLGHGAVAVGCLIAAFLTLNCAASVLFSFPLTIEAKARIGGAFGFVNTAGQLAGIFSPVGIGWLLSLAGGNFTHVFVALCAIATLAVIPAMLLRRPMATQLP
jgi:MFS family permease